MCSACTTSSKAILGLWPYMPLVDGRAGVSTTIPRITSENDELVCSTEAAAGGDSRTLLSQKPHGASDDEPSLAMKSTDVFAREDSPTLRARIVNNAEDIATEIKIHIEQSTEPCATEDSPTLLAWKFDCPDEEERGLGMRPSHSSVYVFKHLHRPPKIGAAVKPRLSPIIELVEDETTLALMAARRNIRHPLGAVPDTFMQMDINAGEPSTMKLRTEASAHGVQGLGLINVPELTLLLSAAMLSSPSSVSTANDYNCSKIPRDPFQKVNDASQENQLGLAMLWPRPVSIEDAAIADNASQAIEVFAGEDSSTPFTWAPSNSGITITAAHSSYSPSLITAEDFVCEIKIDVEPSTEVYAGEGSPTLLAWRYDGPDEDEPGHGMRPSCSSFGYPPPIGAAIKSELSQIIELDENEDVQYELTPPLAEVNHNIPGLLDDFPDTFTQAEVVEAEAVIEQLRAESTARGVPGLGLINVPELTLMLSVATLKVSPSIHIPVESSFRTLPLDWTGPAPAPEPVLHLPRGMRTRLFFLDLGDWIKGKVVRSTSDT